MPVNCGAQCLLLISKFIIIISGRRHPFTQQAQTVCQALFQTLGTQQKHKMVKVSATKPTEVEFEL